MLEMIRIVKEEGSSPLSKRKARFHERGLPVPNHDIDYKLMD